MTKYNNVIYIIDDEPQVLSSMKRLLRSKIRDMSWEISMHESPKAALQHMSTLPPNVVIVDGNMPEMTGKEFLLQLKIDHPAAVRVIITGDSSHNMVLSSSESAHLLLPKPFEEDDLVSIIERGLSLTEFDLPDHTRCALGAINSLPLFPKLYKELVEYLESVDSPDSSKIAEFISSDVSILSKVIQIANSVFFGAGSPVYSAHGAVVRLGHDLIKKLVFYFELYAAYDDSPLHQALQDEAEAVAMQCSQLASYAHQENTKVDQTYFTGLLHNIGQLAIMDHPVDVSADLAGAFLLRLWGFDNTFVDAIRYQSDQDNLINQNPLTIYLSIAKQILNAKKQNISEKELFAQLAPEVIDAVNLSDYVRNL